MGAGQLIESETNSVAIAIRVAGSQVALARAVGVTQQAVAEWLSAGAIPPRRVNDVARATGIPRRVLAPDLFDRCPGCGE